MPVEVKPSVYTTRLKRKHTCTGDTADVDQTLCGLQLHRQPRRIDIAKPLSAFPTRFALVLSRDALRE